jgi:Carboxypeptidase regulatory-like domain
MRRISIGPASLWMVVFQVCLVLLRPANCQVLSDIASANSNPKNTVSGNVVNAVTGEPIRHALVQLNEIGEYLALTDSSGQFEFDDLPPGQATVIVRKPGFFSKEELTQGHTGPTFVSVGQDGASLSLKLFPQGVIYGHVKNPEGEPIERVQVKAITAQFVEGRKRWQIIGTSSTNEDGEFRIANLRPGPYYIEAEPAGYTGPTKARKEGYAPSFYPGAPDMTSATPFEVGLGQQADIELLLRPVPVYKVSGVIAGYPPNTGVQIAFTDRLGNRFYGPQRFDPQFGQFEAQVPAGSYTLEALAWTEGKQLRGEAPVNVTRDVVGISLALTTMQATLIVVRTENTKPVSQSNHDNRDPANLVNLHLIPLGDSLTTQEYWSTIQGSPKPSLVLPNVPPGTYSVEFQPSGSWYVQSAQCGGTDLLHEPLKVIVGAQIPPIEVVLRNDGATLKGRVGKGQNQTWATVVLIPEHSSSNQIKTAHASPDGNFMMPNLPPGSYTVVALDRADTLEYANPDVAASFASQGTAVTLLPNGESQISLELVQVEN